MGDSVIDAEFKEIITRYAREVREEKRRAAMEKVPYDHEGFELRRCIISV